MLFPDKNKPDPIPTSQRVSPLGQIEAESMGKHLDGDNASGKSVKSSSKDSYINLHQRSSVLIGTGSNSPPPSESNSRNDVDEDDDLGISDGEHYGSAEEVDEHTQRIINLDANEIGAKLKHELSKYKQELREYNESTRDLEKKYMKINYELSEMQQKHDHFVGRRGHSPEMELGSEIAQEKGSLRSYSSSTTSIEAGLALQRNNKREFNSNTTFMTVLAVPSADDLPMQKCRQEARSPKIRHNLSAQVDGVYGQRIVDRRTRHKLRAHNHLEDQENEPAPFKDMFNVLQDVINTKQEKKHKYPFERESVEFNQLRTTIKDLQTEQAQFRNIIRHQQDRISDYHTRCIKAQDIMKNQKHEIDKLHVNNKHLETSIYHDIDDLRSKIDSKLKSVAQLPHLMREEHSKYEKVLRENCLMADKLRDLQLEANQLKVKIDELGKRKIITVNRLKAAERDLKIFKNYNAALKTEKRRLAEELSTTKEQLSSLQASSKRQLARHREQTEKQRRELQKRIFDLELKLGRSQNSTSSLIQERDSLIAELQAQLHTLVHNFEVSQKHIRVLRRHIYSMTSAGGSNANNSGSHRASEPNPTRVVHASNANTTRLTGSRTVKNRT